MMSRKLTKSFKSSSYTLASGDSSKIRLKLFTWDSTACSISLRSEVYLLFLNICRIDRWEGWCLDLGEEASDFLIS